tara:strand:+ start:8719 stop:8847 length:129 start_codon:yes stop_codon:yes gene_type:complete
MAGKSLEKRAPGIDGQTAYDTFPPLRFLQPEESSTILLFKVQ